MHDKPNNDMETENREIDINTTFNVLNKSENMTDLISMTKSLSSGFLPLDDKNGDIEMEDIEIGKNNNSNSATMLIENSDNTNNPNNNIRQIGWWTILQSNENWKKFIKEVIHYYTHFLMFIIFEILFYFNYVVEYEQKLIYTMLKSTISDALSYGDTMQIPQNYCNYYSKTCVNLVDGRTNSKNVEIYNNALYLIYGMSGFLIILIVIETNKFSVRSTFPKEFVKSIFLMIFVGVFDYLFFNYFILKYKIIDTPKLMCDLYENGGFC